jgi:hypothetical protein
VGEPRQIRQGAVRRHGDSGPNVLADQARHMRNMFPVRFLRWAKPRRRRTGDRALDHGYGRNVLRRVTPVLGEPRRVGSGPQCHQSSRESSRARIALGLADDEKCGDLTASTSGRATCRCRAYGSASCARGAATTASIRFSSRRRSPGSPQRCKALPAVSSVPYTFDRPNHGEQTLMIERGLEMYQQG